MEKVLITAFEPFGQRTENVSEVILKSVIDTVKNATIVKAILPVVYYESVDKVSSLIELHQPDIIMMLGETAQRDHISIETKAFNLLDSSGADNKGQKFKNHVMYDKSEPYYYANFSAARIKEVLDEVKIMNYVSNDAGRFVCNSLLYGVMRYQDLKDSFAATTFIHLPIYKDENEKNHIISAINHLIYRLFND